MAHFRLGILLFLPLNFCLLATACKRAVPDKRPMHVSDTFDQRTAHPSDTLVLKDTNGLTAFMDTLQSDLDSGSMKYFLARLDQGFDGGNSFGCVPQGCVLKDNPSFARGTAQVLSWYLKLGEMDIDSSHPEVLVVGPSPSTVRFCSPRDTPSQAEQAKSLMAAKNWKVQEKDLTIFVGAPTQTLYDKVGGDSLGIIGASWARKIEEKGGFQPQGYHGKIGVDWMKIETPDGRVGWTRGQKLRDTKFPGITFRLVHLSIGWRILNMDRWGEDEGGEE